MCIRRACLAEGILGQYLGFCFRVATSLLNNTFMPLSGSSLTPRRLFIGRFEPSLKPPIGPATTFSTGSLVFYAKT